MLTLPSENTDNHSNGVNRNCCLYYYHYSVSPIVQHVHLHVTIVRTRVCVYSGAKGMQCLHGDRILQYEAGSDLLPKPEVERENSQTVRRKAEESRGTPVSILLPVKKTEQQSIM